MLRAVATLAVLASGCGGCGLSHEVARRDDAGRRDAGMTRSDTARFDAGREDAGRETDAGADAWLEAGDREAFVEIRPTAIGAIFHDRDEPPGDCTLRADGPCEVEICDRLPDIPSLGVSAGDLTFRAGDDAYVLPFREYYDTLTLSEPAWSLDVATDWAISAPGDVAGGFDGIVTAPATTTLTSPDVSALATLDPNADFEVRWRPAPSGELRIAFRGSLPTRPANYAMAECYFPADAGRGVVPASALGDLPARSRFGVSVYVDIVGRSVAFSRTHRVELTARIPLADARLTLE